MKKKIFVTRRLLVENEEKLKDLFEVTLNKDDKIYTPQEIKYFKSGGILQYVLKQIAA